MTDQPEFTAADLALAKRILSPGTVDNVTIGELRAELPHPFEASDPDEDDAPADTCRQCGQLQGDHPAASDDPEVGPEAGPPTDGPYPILPATLVDGLTIWGDFGGAQIRVESALCDCDEPDTHVAPDSAEGVLYIAHRDGAYQSTEDGAPWRLTSEEARALRDLLNIATARGVL